MCYRPTFDYRDAAILSFRQEKRRHLNTLTSLPRSGDVLILQDGKESRVAYSWHDGVQPEHGTGSYYLTPGGGLSHSGGLQPAIPMKHFVLDGEAKASAWFFHHDLSGAHRGVDCTLMVRRWRYVP